MYANIASFRSQSPQAGIDAYLTVHPEDARRSALITRRDLGRSAKRDCLGEKMLSSSDLVDK